MQLPQMNLSQSPKFSGFNAREKYGERETALDAALWQRYGSVMAWACVASSGTGFIAVYLLVFIDDYSF